MSPICHSNILTLSKHGACNEYGKVNNDLSKHLQHSCSCVQQTPAQPRHTIRWEKTSADQPATPPPPSQWGDIQRASGTCKLHYTLCEYAGNVYQGMHYH